MYKLASLKSWAVTCISCTFTWHNSVLWNVVGPQHIAGLSIFFWTKQIKASKHPHKDMHKNVTIIEGNKILQIGHIVDLTSIS